MQIGEVLCKFLSSCQGLGGTQLEGSFAPLTMASLKTLSGPSFLSPPDPLCNSFADLVGQLCDIDPNRLSFSPFLDLDTQISLAPVSDSPESSVEELRSTEEEEEEEERHPPTPPTAEDPPKHTGPSHSGPETSGAPGVTDGAPTVPGGGCDSVALQMPQETSFLVGSQTGPQSSPPAAADRGSQTSVPGGQEAQDIPEGGGLDPDPRPGDLGPCACRGAGRCSSDHMKAVASAFLSFLFAPWLLYGLYAILPLEEPNCPDVASRVAFALRCLLLTGVPILLGITLRSFSTLCTDPPGPLEGRARPALLHQVFIVASVEQFALFSLNTVVAVTYLAREQLRLIPLLAGLFLAGRFCYWASLHLCSAYRGFGSGLSFFPTLALTAYNLFCLYQLGLNFLFAPLPTTVPVCPTPLPSTGPTISQK